MSWGDPSTTPIAGVLDVITPIANPVRYRSRYDLYARFAAHLASFPGVRHWTVELAHGERAFEVTDAANPRHLQLRTRTELWHKENLINLAVARLPADWRYVAWVDADLTFTNPHWADETLQRLQVHPVVQCFAQCFDLGPSGEALAPVREGFGYAYSEGKDPGAITRGGFAARWHPGFAWAMTRDAWDALGGLFDVAILGAADLLMAQAFIGRLDDCLFDDHHVGFGAYCRRYRERARALARDVGYVPGTVAHHWHGAKANRGYWTRRPILIEHGFDPFCDLRPDWQGVWQLSEGKPALRDAIRGYFRARSEDGTENVAYPATPAPLPPKGSGAGTKALPAVAGGSPKLTPIVGPPDTTHVACCDDDHDRDDHHRHRHHHHHHPPS